MPQQYVASDHQTGLEVQVTGEFPGEPDDRVRIARTTNLFTRLMSTILSTENDTERRERFRAIETQLEIADALIRGDIAEVQRLIRDTLGQMGITEEQLADVERQLREQLEAMGAEGMETLFGDLMSQQQQQAPPEADEPLPQPREDWLPDEPDASDAAESPAAEPPAAESPEAGAHEAEPPAAGEHEAADDAPHPPPADDAPDAPHDDDEPDPGRPRSE